MRWRRGWIKYGLLAVSMLIMVGAASGELEARQRSILQLSNLNQYLDLMYRYDGQTSESDYGSDQWARQHRFDQSYNVKVNYSLVDPSYLNGTLDASLGLKQELIDESKDGDDTDFGFDTEYRFYGIAMEKEPHPLSLYAARSNQDVLRRFSSNYEQEDIQYTAKLQLRNQYLPTTISYNEYRGSTDGLDAERKATTRAWAASVTHVYRSYTTTNATVAFTDSTSETEGQPDFSNELFALAAENKLNLGSDRLKSRLTSKYRLQEQSGDRETRRYLWSELLEWKPGRALDASLLYEHDYDRVPEQTQESDRIEGELRHTLYSSLNTNLLGFAEENRYDYGKEKEYGGFLSLNYRKVLPRLSHLGMEFKQSYVITDQDFTGDTANVIDEKIRIDIFRPNYLGRTNVQTDSVSVFNATRTVRYVEFVDYRLEIDGELTEIVILPAGAISDGDVVSVDYAYLVNQDVRYATWQTTLHSNYSFRQKLLYVYGSVSYSEQNLLAGSDDQVSLNDATAINLGARSELNGHTFGGSYGYFDSSVDHFQSYELFWDYQKRKGPVTYSLYAKDIYYDRNSGSDNILSLGGRYERRFGQRHRGEIYADFTNAQGSNRDRSNYLYGLDYKSRFGRTMLKVSAEMNWEVYDDNWSREDRVYVLLRRYL